MPSRRKLIYFRYFMPIILLGMVLMRLVWLQIRTYSIEVDISALASIYLLELDHNSCYLHAGGRLKPSPSEVFPQHISERIFGYFWFSSPGYQSYLRGVCEGGLIPYIRLVELNLTFLVAVVMICVLISRFLARSWIVGLLVAITILSRGQLTELLGGVTTVIPLMFFFSAWVVSVSHFLRSGSLYMIATALVAYMGKVMY